MRRPADWHAKNNPRTFTANSSSPLLLGRVERVVVGSEAGVVHERRAGRGARRPRRSRGRRRPVGEVHPDRLGASSVARTSSTTSPASSADRAAATTVAPAPASATTRSRPIPRLAPVTSATRPPGRTEAAPSAPHPFPFGIQRGAWATVAPTRLRTLHLDLGPDLGEVDRQVRERDALAHRVPDPAGGDRGRLVADPHRLVAERGRARVGEREASRPPCDALLQERRTASLPMKSTPLSNATAKPRPASSGESSGVTSAPHAR